MPSGWWNKPIVSRDKDKAEVDNPVFKQDQKGAQFHRSRKNGLFSQVGNQLSLLPTVKPPPWKYITAGNSLPGGLAQASLEGRYALRRIGMLSLRTL